MNIRKSVAALPVSATLGANQQAAALRATGKTVIHLGFGQSPFPVHPLLASALARHAGANLYEHVAGIKELRESALQYFATALGLDPDNYDVIVGPGSKLILYALQMAIEGDTIVPVPSWVSYVPQAGLLGDKVIALPTQLSDGCYGIDAEVLRETIVKARRNGANPTKLIVNSPNNPTGLVLPESQHRELARVCGEENIFIISDEIYAQVSFDQRHKSIAGAAPAAAVTTGLSKHLSLGGWRIGFGLIPRQCAGLFDAVCAIASETWSSVSAPVQHAALVAVSGDPALEEFITRTTDIHRAVARYVATAIDGNGVRCRRPTGAFYLWPDFSAMSDKLAANNIRSSAELADALLQQHLVLALPGTGFGAQPSQLCLRLSVCDYDGAQALARCAGDTRPDDLVGDFAPQLVKAADAIAGFARSQ